MIVINYFLGFVGFVLILKRLYFWKRTSLDKNIERGDLESGLNNEPISLPRLSIIIPARNEATNLPFLLKSLNHNKPWSEVIVVDDESSDNTYELAKSYQAKVVSGEPLPDGWTGKNWACHQGVKVATGEYYLFVDADIKVHINRLEEAYRRVIKNNIDMATCIPFHETPTLWEKILAPFFGLIAISSNAFGRHRKNRLFSIGQFLLFKKEYYKRSGGHAYVRSVLAEDLFLARRCVSIHGKYFVFKSKPIFQVRMYGRFKDFVKGWVRNFRLGLKFSSHQAPIEVVLCFYALSGGGVFFTTLVSTILSLSSVMLLQFSMRSFGEFPVWSIFFAPFALILFCVIALMALVQQSLSWPIQWRGRSYALSDVVLSE